MFEGEIVFRYLDALDGRDGQAVFGQLALRGHPSYVIFAPDGAEVYRSFGVVAEETLQEVITELLGSN